ncbi:MAG: Ig-like domain-containing protein, partial [Mariprofundales bacterium]
MLFTTIKNFIFSIFIPSVLCLVMLILTMQSAIAGIPTMNAIGVTNNNTPVFSGTNTQIFEGLTIDVSGPSTFTETAFVQNDLSWLVDIAVAPSSPASLADGDYTVTVTPASTPGSRIQLTFTIDTVSPTITNTTPQIVALLTPTLTGTSEAGANITIDISGNAQAASSYTTTVQADGNWSVTISNPILAGQYNINITATDAAANVAVLNAILLDVRQPVASPTLSVTTPTSTPSVSGTGIAGHNIAISLTNSIGQTIGNIITTTVAINNTWGWVFNNLNDGSYVVKAVQSDAQGTPSPAITANMIVDTVAIAPVINPIGQAITNSFGSTQLYINNAIPFLSGTAEVGAIVYINEFSRLAGTVQTTVDNNGNWSVTLPHLGADGVVNIELYQVDTLGNSSQQTPTLLTFIADTSVNNFAFITLDAKIVRNNPVSFAGSQPMFSGTAETAFGVTANVVNVSITDSYTGASQDLLSNVVAGNWSVGGLNSGMLSLSAPPFSSGTFAVVISMTDEIGNVASITTNITNLPIIESPIINLLQRTVNPLNANSPVISGQGDNLATNASVSIILTNLATAQTINIAPSLPVDAQFQWSLSNTLLGTISDGEYTVEAIQSGIRQAFQVVSTPTQAATTLIIDTFVPPPTMIQPGSLILGSYYVGQTLNISGTAEPLATITIPAVQMIDAVSQQAITLDLTTTVDAYGQWQIIPQGLLAEGVHNLSSIQTDVLGNTSASSVLRRFTVDTTFTPLQILSNATQASNKPAISGSGEASKGATANTVLVEFLDAYSFVITQITTNVDVAGTWVTQSPTNLVNGDYTIRATGTDELGNSNSVTATLTVQVQVSNPSLTVPISGIANPVTALSALVSGTNIANAGVIINLTAVNANQVSQNLTPILVNGGGWSIPNDNSPLLALADGRYELIVTQTTTIGNQIGTSLPISAFLTLDRTVLPPVINHIDAKAIDVYGNVTVNKTVVSIGINGESRALLELFFDGNLYVQRNADALGVFSIALPQMTAATPPAQNITHQVQVFQTDLAGNKSIAATATINLDTFAAPPTVNPIGTAITDVYGVVSQRTNISNPTISGTAENAALIRIANIPRQVFPLSTIADSYGQWSMVLPTLRSDGVVNAQVSQIDSAGNASTATTTSFTLDTRIDNFAITSPALSIISFPVISGTAESALGIVANTVLVSITDQYSGAVQQLQSDVIAGQWSVGGLGSAMQPLANNNFAIIATTTDELGNTASVTQVLGNTPTVQRPVVSLSATLANPSTYPTPLISGTALPTLGTTVIVTATDTYGAGNIFLPVTVSGLGQWALANLPLAGLNDGVYDITAIQQTTQGDIIGQSLATNAQALTIDKQAGKPIITAVNTQAQAGTPIAKGLQLTSTLTRPRLDILAEPHAAINAIVNAGTQITLASTALGTVIFVPTLLEGGNTLQLWQTDASGNNSAIAAFNILVDSYALAPIANSVGILLGNDYYTQGQPIISGTGEANATITIQNLSSTNNAGNAIGVVLTTTVLPDNTWSVQPQVNLLAGEQRMHVTQTDTLGNISPPASEVVFIVDDSYLNLSITSPTNQTLPFPTFMGTGEVGKGGVTNTVNVLLTSVLTGVSVINMLVAVDAAATWSATPANSLINGNYTLVVSATDNVGNTNSITQAITVNIVTQALSINTIAATGVSYLAAANPIISGLAIPGATIDIYAIDAALNSTALGIPARPIADVITGVWSLANNDAALNALLDGSYTIRVQQTSAIGQLLNQAPAVTALALLDTYAASPITQISATVLGTAPNTVRITTATPTISGTAESGAQIRVSGLGNDLFVIADNAGAWSITTPTLTDGSYIAAITQTDLAGNISIANNISFIVDTQYIGLSITSATTHNISFPTISGTAEAARGTIANNITLDVFDIYAAPGSAALQSIANVIINGAGLWSTTLSQALPGGDYRVQVSASDEVANVAIPVLQDFLVDIVVVAPTVDVYSTPNGIAINPYTFTATMVNGTGLTGVGAFISVSARDIYTASSYAANTDVAVDAIGGWVLPNTALAGIPDGRYIISARQYTTTGSTRGTSISIDAYTQLLLDTTADLPTINAIGDTYGAVRIIPAISGTAEPYATITAFVSSANGDAYASPIIADATGLWLVNNLLTPAQDGAFSIGILQTDAAGNSSAIVRSNLVLDKTLTNLTITNPASAASPYPIFTGTAESARGGTALQIMLTIFDNTSGQSQSLTGDVINGQWLVGGQTSGMIPMASGSYNISVLQTDELGNTQTVTQTLFNTPQIDTPLINSLPIATVNPVRAANILLSGNGYPNAGASVQVSLIDVYGTSNVLPNIANVDANGVWFIANSDLQAISDGNYIVSATQTATTGLAIGTSAAITAQTLKIDATPPISPTITAAPTQVRSGQTINISITGLAGAPLSLWNLTDSTGANIPIIGKPLALDVIGNATLALTPAVGHYFLSVQQADIANNVSSGGIIAEFAVSASGNNIITSSEAIPYQIANNEDWLAGILQGSSPAAAVVINRDLRISGLSSSIQNVHTIGDAYERIPRSSLPHYRSVIISKDGMSGINPLTHRSFAAVVTNDATPTISGQMRDGQGNAISLAQLGVLSADITVIVMNVGTFQIQQLTATLQTNGSWSLTLPRQNQGTYQVTAQPIGAGVAFPLDLVIDLTPPVTPNANSIIEVNGSLQLAGTAEPLSRVIVMLEPTVVVGTDVYGQWHATTPQMLPAIYTLDVYSMDLASNTSAATSQQITIITAPDNTPPVVSPPNGIILAAIDSYGVPVNDAAILTFLDSVTATDNIDGTLPITSISNNAPASFLPIGATTVTFTATDAAGNSGSAQSLISVTDQTAPVITPPADILVAAQDANGTASNNGNILAFMAAATVIDNVDNALVINNDALAILPIGINTITFSTSDSAGNTATATANIIVADVVAPTVTAPQAITVAAIDAAGTPASDPYIQAFLLGATVTDNIDVGLNAIASNAPTTFALGASTVIFTASDAANNTGSAQAIITISDQTRPILNVPANAIIAALDANGTPITDPDVRAYLNSASAIDNVNGNVAVNNDAPAILALGTNSILFSAIDNAGNPNVISVQITVVDMTAPVLIAPANITVIATNANGVALNNSAILAFLNSATVTDNVDAANTITINNDANAVTIFPIGTHIITFSASDIANNTVTAQSQITVAAAGSPIVQAPANINIAAIDNTGTPATAVGISTFLNAATAVDQYGNTLTVSNNAPVQLIIGTTTIIFSATDVYATTGTAQATVTISDQTAPVIITPVNVNIATGNLNGLAITDSNVMAFLNAASASDNVDGVVAVSHDAPSILSLGNNTITFVATDAAGNQATQTAQISISLAGQSNIIINDIYSVSGATIDIPIQIEPYTGDAISTFNISLQFDSTYLSEGIIQTTSLPQWQISIVATPPSPANSLRQIEIQGLQSTGAAITSPITITLPITVAANTP